MKKVDNSLRPSTGLRVETGRSMPAPPNGRTRVPVLMYHSVSQVPAGPLRSLAVPPGLLAEQLAALAGAGYRLVGLSEAADLLAAGSADRVAALTFDDGYADFLTAGLPVLVEAGAGATLYPSVGQLGRPADWLGRWAGRFGPLLSWSQLREVAGPGTGIEIGNHGLRHHPLDVLPPAQLRHEVVTSHDRLEQELQREIRSFCYPHGYHNRAVRQAVALAGHQNACQIGRRHYRAGDDRFAIPRLQPTPDHSGDDLVALTGTGGRQLVPRAKRLAQPAWRVTRRVAHRLGRTLT
jgi:peptidoglycan/xylan/chitin deacetylase (PgdA/CDA1 family)